MKKLLILLLALIMVFSFAACKKDKECETHVDSDFNGKCDVCEADVDLPNPDDGKGNNAPVVDTAAVLSNAVFAQLKEAKSAKIELEMSLENATSYWEDETTKTDESYGRRVNTTIIVSDSENGFVAKMTSTITSIADDSEEYSYTEETYVIDGYVYDYYADTNILERTGSSVNVDDIEEAISTLLDGVEISETDKQAALKTIGDFVVEKFKVENGKGSVSVDLKPVYDDLKAYITALDLENDKLSKVVDDALALIDPTLTSASLLAELERVSGLTVNQAIAELDAWLTTNHNTTLQGLYDTIVNDPNVVTVIENLLREQYGSDYEGLEEAIADDIAEMQSSKIADFITEMELGDVVIYDLIISALPATDPDGNEISYPTSEEFFDAIEATLALTLGEFEENMGMPIFTMLKSTLGGIEINALNGKLDLGFDSLYKLQTVGAQFNLDMTNTMPSEMVEGKEDAYTVKLGLKLTVSEISSTEVAVSLPEDALMMPSFIESDLYNDNEMYGALYVGHDEDGFWLHLPIYVDGNTIYVNVTMMETLDYKDGILTVPSELLDISFGGVRLDHDLNTDLTVKIDEDYYGFEILTIPEIADMPSANAIYAIEEIGATAAGENYSDRFTYESRVSYIYLNTSNSTGRIDVTDVDANWYCSIVFSYETNVYGKVVCTVTGFIVDSDHFALDIAEDNYFYGLQEENMELYFDTVTFELKVVDGAVTVVDLPVFADEYKDIQN